MTVEHKIDAKVDQVKGTAKETYGKVVGNKKVETEGKVEKGIGKVKETVEKIKDDIKEKL
ncbi:MULTISPECIES: CsbD family protein [unclassified Lactococcus]|uniref:CsbD family protein n=1 Tax=unclassified Lactococcus TaxID=2643510 RepID=UPI0011C73047|nr:MULTISPECIES: CsbD family protein [unclassified Lactococcus]MQW22376.1 CsbD family protein [Lactococcus sp. dk101]TXK45412.1 CsbD family protein [Lactococcus sp. dk310]TXK51745.1 CsbD family protein [Lactococcus sp. dk322]